MFEILIKIQFFENFYLMNKLNENKDILRANESGKFDILAFIYIKL